MSNINIAVGSARVSAAGTNEQSAFPPPPLSQIDELLERQCRHIEQLEELVRRAAEAFGPALHPELCGSAGEEIVTQPCRSPLGNRLYGYNDRLEQVCVGLNALISRSAL